MRALFLYEVSGFDYDNGYEKKMRVHAHSAEEAILNARFLFGFTVKQAKARIVLEPIKKSD